MPGPPESSPLARDLQSSRIEAGPQCPDVQSAYYFKAGPGGTPLRFLIIPSAVLGAIPTRAGFTTTPPPRAPRSRDHPRSRGVYRVAYDPDAEALGSSPLARGLLDAGTEAEEVPGIIPARAGFTPRRRRRRRCGRDHPRSRGVYPGRWTGTPISRGSSPLARGLLHGERHALAQHRIIPARAGFTGR